ncbi:NAD(P)H-hydrate dehydratase [Helicobacter sp. 11S02629-2]|uniref:NAD(P)H-hydrate dehydratase n=1 Tax=Helicobacter sp. 11S02629-2 TaxID=1476195 RepID=UPI000BA58666|nr:NAD(P)H-hydrate dehydratase [Helicobacter sp. 11S02629-2]PAF43671.1 NAD(P)H-hydrate dehydratase [Helicobacter sp. 11S02629-2]
MKPLFENKGILDSNAVTKLALSNEVLMENASLTLAKNIKKQALKRGLKTVLFCIGSGDNGADGLAAARILDSISNLDISIYKVLESKSNLCKLQSQRASNLNLTFVDSFEKADILVDCVFGTGFKPKSAKTNTGLDAKLDIKTALDLEAKESHITNFALSFNKSSAFKIACDCPSMLGSTNSLKANLTIAMGALSLNLYESKAKDYVGKIKIAPLGLKRQKYESGSANSPYFVLEKSDLVLPSRKLQNVNKGTFGHVCVVSGEFKGASLLCAKAASAFGSALVSVLGFDPSVLDPTLMHAEVLPPHANVLVLGPGLGRSNTLRYESLLKEALNKNLKVVLDADMLYLPSLWKILDSYKQADIILTPHPKELFSMLKSPFDSLEKLLDNMHKVASSLTLEYPNVGFVLKGTNTIIANNGKLYINPLGHSSLAKGGSGDVLSGLSGALLAQGYSVKSAAINASLAHALASKTKNPYSFSPLKLIKNVGKLESRLNKK